MQFIFLLFGLFKKCKTGQHEFTCKCETHLKIYCLEEIFVNEDRGVIKTREVGTFTAIYDAR